MKSIYWSGTTQEKDGFFSHCGRWERWKRRHIFGLGNTFWIPSILYANKTAPALLANEERLTKCPKFSSIKTFSSIFHPQHISLGWGQISPILSLSLCHTHRACAHTHAHTHTHPVHNDWSYVPTLRQVTFISGTASPFPFTFLLPLMAIFVQQVYSIFPSKLATS